MPSQFFKRKAKEAAKATSVEEKPMKTVVVEAAPVAETPVEANNRLITEVAAQTEAQLEQLSPQYPQTAYDIFTNDGGRTFQVAEIHYNPLTGHASVGVLVDITRLVALSYANQKMALGTLTKKGKK